MNLDPLYVMGLLLILGALIGLLTSWAARRRRNTLGAWCVFANIIVSGLAIGFAVSAIGDALQ